MPKVWSFFFFLSSSCCFSAPYDGYTDSLGHYLWLEEVTDSVHVDLQGQKWYKIAEDKALWLEAMTIRKANLLALQTLGCDSLQANKDLFLYYQSNPLFTKESHLLHYTAYIQEWKKAINSDNWSRTARKSQHLKPFGKRTSLVLKYYPQKANIPNIQALGMVRKGFIPHCWEAFLEISESLMKKISGNQDIHHDLLFDLHLRNAQKFLRKYEKGLRTQQAPSTS